MMMANTHIIKGLYAVTPNEPDTKKLIHQIELVNKGGCQLIQYRNKVLTNEEKFRQAAQVKKKCDDLKMTLIINDDIDICCNLNADGVHLGADDDTIEEARIKLGDKKYIGLSCYNSIERVQLALKKRVDYVALGAFFPTKTKLNTRTVSIETLREVKKICSLPIVAIGGITLENVSSLIKEQVDSIAVINGLFTAENLTQTSKNFNELFSYIHG